MIPIAETVRSVSVKARQIAITPESLLDEDMGLDSLDLVAVIVQLQDHFRIEIDLDEVPKLKRVADLAAVMDKAVASKDQHKVDRCYQSPI